jgi:glycosyltransferase involved in cell wall biosynthesis
MNVESAASRPEVSIIVPARNEEASMADCLASLVAQDGVKFEIIVVDDHSIDRTREIATSFPGVRVVSAGPLPQGWTGKNNAVIAGATEARGEWLLFTDADTVHVPGSLARALEEAKREHADLLSYSPEQIAVSFWEMAILPVVFAELARQYPPKKVSDPSSPIVAANGQFILVRRTAYDAIGGHAAIAGELLEDVALARAAKSSGRKIRFRYAADAVRTRMYRNFRQLREGWTKNLALLFPNPTWLAAKTLLSWAFPWGVLCVPIAAAIGVGITSNNGLAHGILRMIAAIRSYWHAIFITSLLYLSMRLRRANFTWDMEVLGVLFGYPMFAYLLLQSRKAHARGSVRWKGRTYSDRESSGAIDSRRLSRPSGPLPKVTSESRQ